MMYEKFGIEELKVKINDLGNTKEKINLVSSELMRCKLEKEKVENDFLNIPIDSLEITIESGAKRGGIIECILNCIKKDKELRKEAKRFLLDSCKNSKINELESYIRSAEAILIDLTTTYQYNDKKNGDKNGNGKWPKGNETKYRNEDLIVWTRGKELLLKLIELYTKRNCFDECSINEILIHFKDENDIPFCDADIKPKFIKWKGSDSFFLILMELLIIVGIVKMENIQRFINMHFCNKKGNPFKYVYQKIYYSVNFSHINEIIENDLKSIGIKLKIVNR